MTPQVIVTIVSVFVGFFLFTASFASFMYKKPAVLTWGLFVVAVFFITVVPVTVAIFWATLMNE
ncbi:hypothetical protein ACGE24_06890 [Corynebacterium kroppenstedtii]|uniref:hypothetical protein n=1 Tax=Corynebacterium sp. PCR 32 TaxID=3351342 RepID=UPI0030ADA8A2